MDTTTSYVEEIDILKPQQLARAIDVEVETNILEPVSHIICTIWKVSETFGKFPRFFDLSGILHRKILSESFRPFQSFREFYITGCVYLSQAQTNLYNHNPQVRIHSLWQNVLLLHKQNIYHWRCYVISLDARSLLDQV